MPRFVWIAIIRLGKPVLAAADAERANAGSMASSSGSDNATPAPRRKLRRDSGRLLAKNGMLMIGSTQNGHKKHKKAQKEKPTSGRFVISPTFSLFVPFRASCGYLL
jgi:hypothetical protein